MTRHPVAGAAQQPRLLYGNLLQMRQLAVPRSPWFLDRNLAVPVWELTDFIGESLRVGSLAYKPELRDYGMAAPRNKSISTKVTDEEYARFEALAGEQTDQRMDA